MIFDKLNKWLGTGDSILHMMTNFLLSQQWSIINFDIDYFHEFNFSHCSLFIPPLTTMQLIFFPVNLITKIAIINSSMILVLCHENRDFMDWMPITVFCQLQCSANYSVLQITVFCQGRTLQLIFILINVTGFLHVFFPMHSVVY